MKYGAIGEGHTQKTRKVFQHRSRIIILNYEHEETNVDYVILPEQRFGNRLKNIQLLEADVVGQPFTRRETVHAFVKAVELC